MQYHEITQATQKLEGLFLRYRDRITALAALEDVRAIPGQRTLFGYHPTRKRLTEPQRRYRATQLLHEWYEHSSRLLAEYEGHKHYSWIRNHQLNHEHQLNALI